MKLSWSIAGKLNTDAPVWSIRCAPETSVVSVDELRRSVFVFHAPSPSYGACSGFSFSLRIPVSCGLFITLDEPVARPRLSRVETRAHRPSPVLRRCRTAGASLSTRLRL